MFVFEASTVACLCFDSIRTAPSPSLKACDDRWTMAAEAFQMLSSQVCVPGPSLYP